MDDVGPARQISGHGPRMFQNMHLFVEILEFQKDGWQETHRMNHGLEEDSMPVKSKLKWTAPHLPHVSLAGLIAFRQALKPELIQLDVEPQVAQNGRFGSALMRSLEQLGSVQPGDIASMEEEMLKRLVMTYRVARAKTSDDLDRQVSPEDLEVSVDDPLQPDAEEESALVLIDEFPCLSEDLFCMVRFSEPVETGLEETNEGGGSCTKSCLLILILGPPGRAASRVQIGEVVATLLQDDAVVHATYNAQNAQQLIDAFDDALGNLSLLPHTTALSPAAIKERAEQMGKQLSSAARAIAKSGGASARTVQNSRWTLRQKNPFAQGFSVAGTISLMQTLAVPLLIGIVLALVLANVDPQGYQHWVGSGHGEESDHGRLLGNEDSEHPTVLGLSIHGHALTLNFIVNDILMVFFFGLAAKEITEALQPGGSLYPPTRSTVNVLAATLGGVLGPVITYLALVAGLYKGGVLNDKFSLGDYAIGWGIPTATDISLAWMSAVSAFGGGHPAINYLLLLAIIDDAIGLVIIAVAYPDPAKPVTPIWLLLILVGMLVAFILRKLQSSSWQSYVFLAGPFSWFGLLWAGLHPALALVFIIPFIPLHLKDDVLTRGADGRPAAHAQQHDDGDDSHGHAPLHEFEESTKVFVDFVVLFGFGAANAGVALDGTGPVTLVVLLSLIVGKTLGIYLFSKVAWQLGFPPPTGMGNTSVLGVGFIASTGLTVALFVSGQAFSENPELAAQAKMGALLSIFVALTAILGSTLRRFLVKRGLGTRSDSADDLEAHTLPGSEVTMEELMIKHFVANLHQVHQAELAVESKTPMTRRETLKKLDELRSQPVNSTRKVDRVVTSV